MTPIPTARDLMRKTTRTIAPRATVGEACDVIATPASADPRIAYVVDADERLVGVVTALEILVEVSPKTPSLGDRLLARPVSDVMVTDVPVVLPTAGLVELMRCAAKSRRHSIPVVESGRFVGVVRLVDIFQAAAGLALTPGTSGIRTDRT